MKIRSTVELSQFLADALAWRKLEISAIFGQIAAAPSEQVRNTGRRAGVAILYAHWEGFAKEASEAYLDFAFRSGGKLGNLLTCFTGVAFHGRIRAVQASKHASGVLPVVELLLESQAEKSALFKGSVDTESNLSSAVLCDILAAVGLDYSRWESRELLLDGSLLEARNEIAHGKRRSIDDATYLQLQALVLSMLDDLKVEVEDAAVSKSFLKNPGH